MTAPDNSPATVVADGAIDPDVVAAAEYQTDFPAFPPGTVTSSPSVARATGVPLVHEYRTASQYADADARAAGVHRSGASTVLAPADAETPPAPEPAPAEPAPAVDPYV